VAFPDVVSTVNQVSLAVQHLQVRPSSRLRDDLPGGPTNLPRQCIENHPFIDARVPYVQVPHLRVLTHVHPVAANNGPRGLLAQDLVGPEETLSHDGTGGKPLEIPLPRTGQGLVEIVDAEHEVTLGRREDAEVRHVYVAAHLDRDAGGARTSEVARHHRGASPQKRKGRFEHSRVPNRYHLGESSSGLSLQRRDGILPFRRQHVFGMQPPRQRCAQRLAHRQSRFHRGTPGQMLLR
jgi:hypothetical protein